MWVHGPGNEPWEVYTVKEDSQTYGVDGPVGMTKTMADPDAQAQESRGLLRRDGLHASLLSTVSGGHGCREVLTLSRSA